MKNKQQAKRRHKQKTKERILAKQTKKKQKEKDLLKYTIDFDLKQLNT